MLRIFINDERLAAAMLAKRTAVGEALMAKMNVMMANLQKKIVTEKLSGQVLHRHSGKLAGSVIAHPAEWTGTTLIGSVEAAGGPAFYGFVHEFGGSREYEIRPVNKEALAFFPGGTLGGGGGFQQVNKATLASLFNVAGSLKRGRIKNFREFGGIVVKSVIHPPLPQRSFMRTSLAESKEIIKQGVVEAIATGLRKGRT